MRREYRAEILRKVTTSNEGERLPQGVKLIRAGNTGPLTLSGTNTYLVGIPPWVVDPGPAEPEHVERVVQAIETGGGLAGIALTHRHFDHADAVPLLRQQFPVEVVAGRRADERGGPFSEPEAAGLVIDRELDDGVRAGPFLTFSTPGHSADHISLLAGEVLFCGDTVLGEGSVFIPPGGGSLKRYLESLRRLQSLELAVLCPGHGPVVWDPQAKLAEYLEHRLDRERRLVAALGQGLRSRDELLDAVWDDAPAVLRPAAALTLEAHLDKLEGEGRLPADVDRLSR
jgi:glyoxylase-like metal-dependent hydrolase (beta-lactamase superfamily II)